MSRIRSLAVDHDVSRVPRQTSLLITVFLLCLTLERSLTTTKQNYHVATGLYVCIYDRSNRKLMKIRRKNHLVHNRDRISEFLGHALAIFDSDARGRGLMYHISYAPNRGIVKPMKTCYDYLAFNRDRRCCTYVSARRPCAMYYARRSNAPRPQVERTSLCSDKILILYDVKTTCQLIVLHLPP